MAKFARTIAAIAPIATAGRPSIWAGCGSPQASHRVRRKEVETCRKSHVKQAPRTPKKATQKKTSKPATKRPASVAIPNADERIAKALEAIAASLSASANKPSTADSLKAAAAFIWHPDGRLTPVPRVNRVELGLLKGVDRMRDILIENTERFAKGLPANNALLWGARGMGKSSLVKAAHATVNAMPEVNGRLKLIEIHREDIESLPSLMSLLRESDFHFIVFCDDLSFDGNDASYKSLKAVLEGGIEGRPENVILYATSNRRHLLARDMIENERSTSINPGEAVEEKVSLSDRFGLWLGFHKCNQDEYLDMVKGYCRHFGVKIEEKRARA